MSVGWVKVWREIENHWIFKNAEYFRGFLYLIMNANIEDKIWNHGTSILKIPRGCLVISNRKLAENLNWTIGRTVRFLKKLKSEDMIKTYPYKSFTVIEIVNFGKYQDKPDGDTLLRTDADTPLRTGSDTPFTDDGVAISDTIRNTKKIHPAKHFCESTKEYKEGKKKEVNNNNRQKKEFGGDRAENIREDFFDTYLDSLSRQFPGYNIVKEFDDEFCPANTKRKFQDVEEIFKAFYSFLKS